MAEPKMTNKETAAHLRNLVTKEHEVFARPTDACGYIQSVRFAQYKNENWETSSLDGNAFILSYADKIENVPDTLCLCNHPNEKVGYLCYCCKELSCRYSGYKSDGTKFEIP